MTWIKVKAGEYRSECGNYEVRKTYSRSGWICVDKATGWHTYQSTASGAKDVLECRASRSKKDEYSPFCGD